LIYMIGIGLSIRHFIIKIRSSPLKEVETNNTWMNMVFLVSILGTGLFVYYQGRSHEYNLPTTFWTAFFLLSLFADSLISLFSKIFIKSPDVKSKIFISIQFSLPLLILLVVFLYTPAFFKLTPTYIQAFQSRVQTVKDLQRGIPNSYTRRIDFMKKYFSPGENAVIFSGTDYTVFYIYTQTINPVKAPGWEESFLQSDLTPYYDYLRSAGGGKIIMSDYFSSNYLGLYQYIQEHYVEIDKFDDLGIYIRK
jgi:hypothetical protein